MRIGDAARGLLVVNNTIYNAHVHCIWCDPYWGDAIMLSNASGSDNYYTQHVGVYNNVIVDSAAAVYGGVVISSPTNTVDYNLSWNISTTNLDCAPDCNFNPLYGLYELYTAGAHNMKGVNPLFVDPRRHDYHLRAGSPARGKANPGYTPPRDADGNRRPAAPALGAFR